MAGTVPHTVPMGLILLYSVEVHLLAEAYSRGEVRAASVLLRTVPPAPQGPAEQQGHVMRSHPPSPKALDSQMT